LEIGKIESPVR